MLKQKKRAMLSFKEVDRERIMRALRKDVAFLREKKIMDYSLLLGVEQFDMRAMTS